MTNDEFIAFIAPLEKMIFNIARRYTLNAEDAKDTAQDSIIKMYEYLRKPGNGIKASKAWAARVTVNAAIDGLRKRKARPIRTT